MANINYIVSLYGGTRRWYSKTPIFNFIDTHINFIKKNPENISGITFILNNCDSSCNTIAISEYLNKNLSKINISSFFFNRPNLNGSYGAWEHGLLKTYKKFTHSFLIEDDYIPVRLDFTNFFLKKCLTDTYFVASLYREDHAAISNGLLNNSKIDKVLKVNNKLFNLTTNKKGYSKLFFNQRNFLKYFTGTVCDICDVGHTIFMQNNKQNILYGNEKKPLLIKPIS